MSRPYRKGPRKAKEAMDAPHPMERRQCTATSKQSGVQCKRLPIPGGNVCVMHGGKAPQVKAAAEARLAALVDPAITRLAELVAQKDFPSTAYQAVRDVLDRAGLQPPERVEHLGEIVIRHELPDD